MRKQTAVWWKKLSADEFGDPAYDDPVEIACRWEDKAVRFLDEKGEVSFSRSVVYVDRVISVGDLLRLGELESGMTSDVSELTGFVEVRRFENLPTLRATQALYTAYA